MLLEVKDLSVVYGNSPAAAVQGVNLTVAEGQIVSLVGINGAGKSSLLNALVGLIPIKAGQVIFNQEDITGINAQNIVKKGMALVPEGRRIFSSLTVEENLIIGGAVNSRDRQLFEKTRQEVYGAFPILQEKKKFLAGSLSGGQQQQLAIGRALMSTPRLLLLDEPSLGLAPLIVEKMFEDLVAFKNKGFSLLLVEQNVPLSLSVSDYVYLMEGGSITRHGDKKQLTESAEELKSFYTL